MGFLCSSQKRRLSCRLFSSINDSKTFVIFVDYEKCVIFVFGVLIFGNELTSLDMGGTGQKQLLLILEVAVSFFFAIFATLASFDAQARRGRLTREGQSSFLIS